jgi:hypothetical protein
MSAVERPTTPVRAVVLARHRPATAAARAAEDEVHLIPLPLRGAGGRREAVSALCGAQLRTDQLETVVPGHGLWCSGCFVTHVLGGPDPSPDAPGVDAVAGRPAAGAAYQRLGWPVTVRGHQVSLNLDLDAEAVGVAVPAELATEVTGILLRRRCPPPVLAHPALPSHRIIIAGERYPVPLAWPVGVHRITTTVLLPPTVTDYGPVCWVRPPVPDALRLCREIDVAGALRTALGSTGENVDSE